MAIEDEIVNISDLDVGTEILKTDTFQKVSTSFIRYKTDSFGA